MIEIRCPFCKALFKRATEREDKHPIIFCAYCGSRLRPTAALDTVDQNAILLKEHAPKEGEVIGSIGHFLLLKSIGRGGMGEVFLAFDTICGRRVALKRIRPDLLASPQLKSRFIREARITSQLIHPSIIPIYNLHIDTDLVYYTMPFMAGETLKMVLARAAEQEAHDVRTSIPPLIRIFLGVLQAVAYAHSRGVLHRDIKPENIIIGTYGQVIILDWGLTILLEEIEDDSSNEERETARLTRIGKPVGTVPYMAPERVQGHSASKKTDIYALGVILYQILTLKLPFSRKNMKNFMETWDQEKLVPPEIKAPYRDVPQALSEIVKKCLAPNPDDRYASCDELISHIESYLEGRSEWFPVSNLSIERKSDWEFQENVLLAEHVALTSATELTDWYSLMISEASFAENVRLEVKIHVGHTCSGIGFILCSPSPGARRTLIDGYCLWISTAKEQNRPTTLFRSSVCVVEAPDVSLSPSTQQIRLEKIDQTIKLYIDGVLQLSYTSHIPVVGTHVGILAQDADFDLESCAISTGSQSIMVNCLAVPDAFLTSHNFERALTEYRRVGVVFSGRAEGREAMFRAGVTLLEQGKTKSDREDRELFFDRASHEFHALKDTPGAPLEYLGKALIYQTTQEFEEEIKCFEIAFRRYKHHPLLSVLVEQLLLRMHEMSRQHRVAAYHFISFVVRFRPDTFEKPSSLKLIESLKRHWEIPPFFLSTIDEGDKDLRMLRFSMSLAFWIERPHVVIEIFEKLIAYPVLPIAHIVDCLSLFFLFYEDELVRKGVHRWRELLCADEQERYAHLFHCLSLPMIDDEESLLCAASTHLSEGTPGSLEAHMLLILMERALSKGQYQRTISLFKCKGFSVWYQPLEEELLRKALEASLWMNDLALATSIVESVGLERLENENSPLFFPYGCFLAKMKGHVAAHAHFEQTLDAPYPRSWLLGAHVITNKIVVRPKGWYPRSFPYERRVLLQQLKLYTALTQESSYDQAMALLCNNG